MDGKLQSLYLALSVGWRQRPTVVCELMLLIFLQKFPVFESLSGLKVPAAAVFHCLVLILASFRPYEVTLARFNPV